MAEGIYQKHAGLRIMRDILDHKPAAPTFYNLEKQNSSESALRP
jgi:hypothetical protein